MGEETTRGAEAERLPVRCQVKEVLFSRYPAGQRPISWDERSAGIECVRTVTGETILLESSGQQSSPAPFWELLLTEKRSLSDSELPKPLSATHSKVAYSWTLYGIAKGAPLGRYDSE